MGSNRRLVLCKYHLGIVMSTDNKSQKDNSVDTEEKNPKNDEPPDDPSDDVSDNLLLWIDKKDK